MSLNTLPELNTKNLCNFQFPINESHHRDETHSIPTLFHLQKRRYSSVSVNGQPENLDPPDEEDSSMSTPPKHKFSILNSQQSVLTSPISGLISSPLSPRRITNIVSPLQIAIQQAMTTNNTTLTDLHDFVIQILLEHEKLKMNNQERIDSYRNQIEKTEESLETHLKENNQLKMTLSGLNKDVQFLKLKSERSELDHQNKILEMKNKLERKERDLSKLLALSQRLEHENVILNRIQEMLCGKVDAMVKQLEDKEVAISYLEEIVNIMRLLIEEKNRESYEKTEHVYGQLCDLSHQLSTLNGANEDLNTQEKTILSNKKKNFEMDIHSLRDELKRELNDCFSTMYNVLNSSHCEKRVQLIQNKLEELRLQTEEQEKILHQSNERLIQELGKKMEEISHLQLDYSMNSKTEDKEGNIK